MPKYDFPRMIESGSIENTFNELTKIYDNDELTRLVGYLEVYLSGKSEANN